MAWTGSGQCYMALESLYLKCCRLLLRGIESPLLVKGGSSCGSLASGPMRSSGRVCATWLLGVASWSWNRVPGSPLLVWVWPTLLYFASVFVLRAGTLTLELHKQHFWIFKRNRLNRRSRKQMFWSRNNRGHRSNLHRQYNRTYARRSV